MNLKTRIERVESHLGNFCLLCNADLKDRFRRDEEMRASAENYFNQYMTACGDRQLAIDLFSRDAPSLARAAGVLNRTDRPGFCPSCYEDKRTSEQIDADQCEFVRECLETLVAADFSRDEALAFIKENGPHLLRYV